MKTNEIKVKVSCDLTVDKNTAQACLRLVQIYLNSNPSIKLEQKQLESGEVELNYEPS